LILLHPDFPQILLHIPKKKITLQAFLRRGIFQYY